MARLLHRLTGVARLGPGEFLRVVGNLLGQAGEQTAALGRRQATPGAFLHRLARRGDGEVHVRRATGSDFGKNLTLGRRDHRNGAAGRGGRPAIIDENALGGTGDVHAVRFLWLRRPGPWQRRKRAGFHFAPYCQRRRRPQIALSADG